MDIYPFRHNQVPQADSSLQESHHGVLLTEHLGAKFKGLSLEVLFADNLRISEPIQFYTAMISAYLICIYISKRRNSSLCNG
jgi:hypothetical protein